MVQHLKSNTCASTLSLMAAEFPIKAPVAGISVGLITDNDDEFVTITDIQGIEDHRTILVQSCRPTDEYCNSSDVTSWEELQWKL